MMVTGLGYRGQWIVDRRGRRGPSRRRRARTPSLSSIGGRVSRWTGEGRDGGRVSRALSLLATIAFTEVRQAIYWTLSVQTATVRAWRARRTIALEEILPHIYGVRILYVNAFLLAEDEGITLIDSGLANRTETFLRALSEIKRTPGELKHILLTHHHTDHTGSLAALVEASGAEVWIHPLDAPVVRGEEPVPGLNPKSIMSRILWPLAGRLSVYNTLAPTRVDHEVADGEELPAADGIKVVHTPGHTAGHTCYRAERHGGVLFVGDAAGNVFGRLGPPLAMSTEDMDEAKQSMAKLAGLEFDVACFGHGSVLKGKANVAFRRQVEKLAR